MAVQLTLPILVAQIALEVIPLARKLFEQRDAAGARAEAIATLTKTKVGLEAYLETHPDDGPVRRSLETIDAILLTLNSQDVEMGVALFDQIADAFNFLRDLLPGRESRAFEMRLQATADTVAKGHVAVLKRAGALCLALLLAASALTLGACARFDSAGTAYYKDSTPEPGIVVRTVVFEFPPEVTDVSQVTVLKTPTGEIHAAAVVGLEVTTPTLTTATAPTPARR